MQLQGDLEKIQAAGIQVVGISYDAVDVLKRFTDARSITFPLLSDEASRTIHRYGIHSQRGLPHPVTLLIDQDGVVSAKLSHDGYRTRHSSDELIDAARQLD